ncbi:hypothetical protein T484DRAFT_1777982 [Baffinella frigidus]|nr:hypothetical protein T484DRAFT_1777982 [Cryptophyta sp. CCMP2293]
MHVESKLIDLEYLNADYNLLSHLPESLTQLAALTELSVEANRITQLPSGLAVLTNLTRINVSKNPIPKLPLDFGMLRPTLRRLDIDLPLQLPPPEISSMGFPIIMRYLEDLLAAASSCHLEAMGLSLEAIPAEVVDLTQLTALLLAANSIHELHLGVCNMANLTELWLSSNDLERFPREACERLTALTALRLDRNRISVVPSQIGCLTNLVDLRLNDNDITILPLECGNLIRLASLILDVEDTVSPYPQICARGANISVDLRGLGLTTFPVEIYTIPSITAMVDLRGLGLTTFPVEIYTIPSITALHLDDNYLQARASFPSTWVEGGGFNALPPSLERLTALTELSVTNLQLQSLPFVLGAMTGLTDLRLTASRTMSNPPYEIVVQGTEVLLEFIKKSYQCVRRTGKP